jgi:hypothetical protein
MWAGYQEEHVDTNRFDNISRMIGEQTDRRGMLKTAAGGALGVLGLSAVTRVALGQDVAAEGGFKGQNCNKDANCKKGLICNQTRGKCEYEKKCGGKNGDACKKNNDCCGGFQCKGKKCRRKKKN